jgi:hypothetical protein
MKERGSTSERANRFSPFIVTWARALDFIRLLSWHKAQ